MKQLLLLPEREGFAIVLSVLFLGRPVGPSICILALLGHYCNEVALKEMKGKLAISWDNTYRC